MKKTINDVALYWNQRPCNSRHSTASVDTAPGQYSYSVTQRKYFVEPHLWFFAHRHPAPGEGTWVLDMGCGIGTESLMFARMGAQVTGLDISRESVKIAIKRAIAEKLNLRTQFGVWNMEDGPEYMDRGVYDLVWAWGSVHHTPNPETAMRQLVKYLKPGGELRMMVYHRLSTKALRLWATAGFPKDFDGAVARGSEAQPGCPITHTYTRRMARKLVGGAGLVVESVEVDHIFPYDGEAYGQHQLIKGRPWRWMPKWLFRRLERVLGWHLMIVARREG